MVRDPLDPPGGDATALDLEAFGLRNPPLPRSAHRDARRERVDAILAQARNPEAREGLIAVLQRVQEQLGYLPRDVLEELARHTGLSLARIYGVATFYNSFHLRPRGRFIVRACEGTACHVSGGPRITEAVENLLGITAGDTTADGRFTLEKVACLGCCSLAPVMTVNRDTHGRLDSQKAAAIVHSIAEGWIDGSNDEPGGGRPR